MKTCSSCKHDLPLDAFNKNVRRRDGLQNTCRECNKAHSKRYYGKNIDRFRTKRDSRRLSNRALLYEYVSQHPCALCGESDPAVLQFDHLRDKVAVVSRMMDYSWESILKEIEKCQVLCANCHARKTAKEHGWYAGLK